MYNSYTNSNDRQFVPTYTYKVSTQSKLNNQCDFGQEHEVHPLYPESKLPIQSIKLTDVNAGQTVFQANDCVYVGSPITFNDTGYLNFNTGGATVSIPFYFGYYDNVDIPVDTSEKSLDRRLHVDEHFFLDDVQDPAKNYVGVFYTPCESYEQLLQEINMKIQNFAKCFFSVQDLRFRFEFFFANPDLLFEQTPFSSWLGFTQQTLAVRQIATPYLVNASTKPANMIPLTLHDLPLQNVHSIVEEMNRQVSGILLKETVTLSIETSLAHEHVDLPTYIDEETMAEILRGMDLLVTSTNGKFLLSHKLGQHFRLRTSAGIHEFHVNHTQFSTTHSITHYLPKLSLRRRLRFFLDERDLLHVETSTASFGDDVKVCTFGGYRKIRNGLTFEANGTLNGDKTKITFATSLQGIFGTEKQVFVCRDSSGKELVLRKELGNTYIILSYAGTLTGKLDLDVRIDEEALVIGAQVLYFPDDIVNRRIFNVHQCLHYISTKNLHYQLSSIAVNRTMKFAFFLKVRDFPMKSNWQVLGQGHEGFKDNIIAKVYDNKLSASKLLKFSFPSFIHGLKFTVIDEYGKNLCCSSPMQMDFELVVGSKLDGDCA